jgi:hypothetical protein
MDNDRSAELLDEPIVIYRIMDYLELKKYLDGEKIQGKEYGHYDGSRTPSRFFFPEKILEVDGRIERNKLNDKDVVIPENPGTIDEHNITTAANLLRGSGSDIEYEFLVSLETNIKPNIDYGAYWSSDDEKVLQEYYYPEYDNHDFHILEIYKMEKAGSIDTEHPIFSNNGNEISEEAKAKIELLSLLTIAKEIVGSDEYAEHLAEITNGNLNTATREDRKKAFTLTQEDIAPEKFRKTNDHLHLP